MRSLFFACGEAILIGLMQKAAFACGNMVLYLFCMSFFRPLGEKRHTKGVNSLRKE
jgi:hypothetical protein